MNLMLTLVLLTATGSLGSPNFAGVYNLFQSTVIKYEGNETMSYRLSSKLNVVYKGPSVYLLTLVNPKLEVSKHGTFTSVVSGLDNDPNKPFLIELESGVVSNVHLSKLDSVSLRNIKRAIASLFQFQTSDVTENEVDASGKCKVRYSVAGSNVKKIKDTCFPSPSLQNGIWGGKLQSDRQVNIQLSSDKMRLQSVISSERHSFSANLANINVSSIFSQLSIEITEDTLADSMKYNDEVALQTLIEIGGQYKSSDLKLEPEFITCNGESCQSLDAVVRSKMSDLGKYGTVQSAASVHDITASMRRSDQKEVLKVLKDKSLKNILPALMDCAGSCQTDSVHQAALQRLRINTNQYNLDLTERYLWSSSISPIPSVNITRDVLSLLKEKHKDSKLQATLVLTAAALAKKVAQAENSEVTDPVVKEVADAIKKNLKSCGEKDEDCRQLHLKALGAMQNSYNKKILIKYSTESTKKSGARAMHGLYKLGPEGWDLGVLETAEKVLQSATSDASARLAALDLLFAARPDERTISMAADIILSPTPAIKELATLSMAKLKQLGEKDPSKIPIVKKVLSKLNWNTAAIGGLSTSFTRDFSSIGFLSTDQELAGGVLKRGYVNVNVIQNGTPQTAFTLGIFAAGLGSFVSQNEGESNEVGEEEDMTAGMELEVLGVELRPFVFFTGSGELMGHIWSGTASSDTPAYQAAALVGLSESSVAIGSAGITVNFSLSTAASVQLSGEAEVSIWNRNAHSVVRNFAALSLRGKIFMENSLVQFLTEAEVTTEPRLLLTSDIDFSGNTALCLKLDQPPTFVRFQLVNTEKIVGSRHIVRRTHKTNLNFPGLTYALNKKNNEMCALIHQ